MAEMTVEEATKPYGLYPGCDLESVLISKMIPLTAGRERQELFISVLAAQDQRERYLAANPEKNESVFPKPLKACTLNELLAELNHPDFQVNAL